MVSRSSSVETDYFPLLISDSLKVALLLFWSQMELDRVKAEAQAKVDAEKENEQVALRKIRAQV